MPTEISKEKMRALQKYFIKTVKNGQSRTFEATIQNIADGSGIALATAHRGIKELEERGILKVSKTKSRRFPCVYMYNGDLEEFKEFVDKDAQIRHLQQTIESQRKEISRLKQMVKKYKNK